MPETWCPYGCKSYAGALTRISPLRAFFLSFHADPTPEIVCSWSHLFICSADMSKTCSGPGTVPATGYAVVNMTDRVTTFVGVRFKMGKQTVSMLTNKRAR